MATACGSLEHIFVKPLLPDENQTFLESLSPWKHIKDHESSSSSFTEILGELHFRENIIISHDDDDDIVHNNSSTDSESSSPSSSLTSSLSSSMLSARPGIDITNYKKDEDRNKWSSSSSYRPLSSEKTQYKDSDSFSSMNSESLSLCTERLGFESFGTDVEDLVKNDDIHEGLFQEERESYNLTRNNIQKDHHHHHKNDYLNRSRICRGDFPPPISCIGRSGKPWVCFKSYREDGGFILKEIRIPTQEFLHACREDGRLRLQFIHSDDEIFEDDDDDEEEEEDEDDDNEEQNEVDDDKEETNLDYRNQEFV